MVLAVDGWEADRLLLEILVTRKELSHLATARHIRKGHNKRAIQQALNTQSDKF